MNDDNVIYFPGTTSLLRILFRIQGKLIIPPDTNSRILTNIIRYHPTKSLWTQCPSLYDRTYLRIWKSPFKCVTKNGEVYATTAYTFPDRSQMPWRFPYQYSTACISGIIEPQAQLITVLGNDDTA